MQQGRIVETAEAARIFKAPAHAYTRKLMRAPQAGGSLPDLLPEAAAPSPPPGASPRRPGEPLLVVENLVKAYPRQVLRAGFASSSPTASSRRTRSRSAPSTASPSVGRGETVGLVGESGCGKSTTSMMITRLLDPTEGRILFAGEDIGAIPASRFARLQQRRRIQMVFQDPTDSLNPRFTASRAIADPLLRLGERFGRAALAARVEELARLVGLPTALLDRFPHQLSGGQKARVGIARAIALDPDLVILDEPTAALDVSVQAVVLNLLDDLKARLGMSYLFVSHDLNVVRLLCDRVIVMRQGRIVEAGDTATVLGAPTAAYTQELLDAIPHPPD